MCVKKEVKENWKEGDMNEEKRNYEWTERKKHPRDLQNKENEYVSNKQTKIPRARKDIIFLLTQKKKKKERGTYKGRKTTIYHLAPFSAPGYKKIIPKEF